MPPFLNITHSPVILFSARFECATEALGKYAAARLFFLARSKYETEEDELVTIYIPSQCSKPDPQIWTVPSSLLYRKAPFLESLQKTSVPTYFQGMKSEIDRTIRSTRTIELPDENPKIFNHIISWVQNHEVFVGGDNIKEEEKEETHISEWCQLHVTASKYRIKALAIFALRKYIHGSRKAVVLDPESFWFPTVAEVRLAYYAPSLVDEEGDGRHHRENQEQVTSLQDDTKKLLRSTLAHILASHLLSTLFGSKEDMEHWFRITGAHRVFWKDVMQALKAHMWERRERCMGVACAVHDILEHPWIEEGDIEDVGDGVVESFECSYVEKRVKRKIDDHREEKKKRKRADVILLDD
ncbi:hypothetical protein BP5796_01100 [Coleophoma crateriformis]|uniref:BTB domain-containing protein n=1 Tax=Coleophoma crateriformis TaxID=565419 RepID=A0A3D8T9Z2_9HELO|nr:hypothetical protein BP5796_01100 [Coleophoma crateriformis]